MPAPAWICLLVLCVMSRPVKAGRPHPEEAFQHPYLVIAAAGDVSEHGLWMDGLGSANFDIILLYYGSDTNFTCPQCREVVVRKGPKWRLLYEYMTSNSSSWPALSHQYKAVMVPDDDLRMNSGTISSAFAVFSRNGLLLGQPSVCRSDTSSTYWETVKQKMEFQLHFTAFVEVMAPMFEISFFNNTVLDTLSTAYSGWGLDLVWPFLLGYPKDKVGVIDAVCMDHPTGHAAKQGRTSIYSTIPKDRNAELKEVLDRYGVTKEAVESQDLPFWPSDVIFWPALPPSAANTSAATGGSSAAVRPDEQQQQQEERQHAGPASEAQQADCQGDWGRCKRTLRRAEPTLQKCGAAALSWIGGGWPLFLSVALLAMLCYAALYHQPARYTPPG